MNVEMQRPARQAILVKLDFAYRLIDKFARAEAAYKATLIERQISICLNKARNARCQYQISGITRQHTTTPDRPEPPFAKKTISLK